MHARSLAVLLIAVAAASAGDEPAPRTLTIGEVRQLKALSDDKWGKAFALLGSVHLELDGVFRLRAHRAVVWLDPKAGATLLDLMRGARSKERRIPIWAVRAIYAEGGRVPALFHTGGRVFRCASMFYDLEKHTGILVDAAFRLRRKDPLVDELPDLVSRARRVIARGPGRWTARDLSLFTTDYHEPEIAVHVDRLELRDEEVEKALGVVMRLSAGGRKEGQGVPAAELERALKQLEQAAFDFGTLVIDMYDTSARLFGVSILSWPHIRMERELLRLRVEAEIGSRGRLGDGGWVGVGIRNKPIGFLIGGGYFANRGTLVDLEVLTDAFDGDVFGRSITSYLRDHGVGQPFNDRYWTQHRYRWKITSTLRLDGELALLSDANWLLTYDEREFKEGKAQESLLHLRHRDDLGYVSLVAKARTISFIEDVEELPRLSASLPVLTVVSVGRAVVQLAMNAEVSNVRLRRAKGDPAPDLRTGRIDLDPTLLLSFHLGPVRVVPYAQLRYTGYDQTATGGQLSRFAGTFGVRADVQLWRWHGARRHVLNLSLEYKDLATVSQAATRLFPIDAVDMLTPYEALIIRIRNRLQQRTDSGVETFLTLEIHGEWFPNRRQPLGRMGDGFIDISFAWWREEEIGFGARADIDPELGVLSSGAIETWWQATSRLLVAVGVRHLEDDSDVLTVSAATSVDTRWRFVFFSQFDLKNGEGLDQGLIITRMGKTAAFSVRLAFDPGEDNFSLSFKIDLVEAFRKREARAKGEIRLSEFSAR